MSDTYPCQHRGRDHPGREGGLLIPERTREAPGAKPGGRTHLDEARRRSVAVRTRKADRFAAGVLPIIDELRRQGITSSRKLAAALNARGVRTARGAEWGSAAVLRVLGRG